MVDDWIIWLGGVAAAVTSIRIIWTRAIRPAVSTIGRIWSALRRMADAWDVLYEIAEQFKPNGGSTLHDRISLLEIGQHDMTAQLEQALSFHPTDDSEPPEIDDEIGGTPV